MSPTDPASREAGQDISVLELGRHIGAVLYKIKKPVPSGVTNVEKSMKDKSRRVFVVVHSRRGTVNWRQLSIVRAQGRVSNGGRGSTEAEDTPMHAPLTAVGKAGAGRIENLLLTALR